MGKEGTPMLSRTAAIVGIAAALLSGVVGGLLFLVYADIADAFGEELSMRSRVNSLLVLIAPALVALIGIAVAKSWNSWAGKLLIVAGALWMFYGVFLLFTIHPIFATGMVAQPVVLLIVAATMDVSIISGRRS